MKSNIGQHSSWWINDDDKIDVFIVNDEEFKIECKMDHLGEKKSWTVTQRM